LKSIDKPRSKSIQMVLNRIRRGYKIRLRRGR